MRERVLKRRATNEMIRGLVRAAELREQAEGGRLWDDECRNALETARSLGWGKNQTGCLYGIIAEKTRK